MVRTMKLFFLVIGCIPLLGGGGCCGLAMAVGPEEEDEGLFRKGINTEGGTNPRTTVASYHERSQEEMMMFEGRVELEAFGVGTSFKAITTPLIHPTQIAKAIDPMNSKSPFITETSNEDTSKEKTPLGVAAVPPTLAKVGMGKFKDQGQPLSYHTVQLEIKGLAELSETAETEHFTEATTSHILRHWKDNTSVKIVNVKTNFIPKPTTGHSPTKIATKKEQQGCNSENVIAVQMQISVDFKTMDPIITEEIIITGAFGTSGTNNYIVSLKDSGVKSFSCIINISKSVVIHPSTGLNKEQTHKTHLVTRTNKPETLHASNIFKNSLSKALVVESKVLPKDSKKGSFNSKILRKLNECTSCTDIATPWMENNEKKCETTGLVPTKCYQSNYWKENKYCQLSCFKADYGYEGDACCDNQTLVPCNICTDEETPWMKRYNKDCSSSNQLATKCNFNYNWANRKYCQHSCFEEGNGYDNDNCCFSTETPTKTPTNHPSSFPSNKPTPLFVSVPSKVSTSNPSQTPSQAPSGEPSAVPTSYPSQAPSKEPSGLPSLEPSKEPSKEPSSVPSSSPSVIPSAAPSVEPSSSPSVEPIMMPSSVPSASPSVDPSESPSADPSRMPSLVPSKAPSGEPSTVPSSSPSVNPSAAEFSCVGTCERLAPGCFRLTKDESLQTGNFWNMVKLNVSIPFSLEFTMYAGSYDDFGADGLVFVLQDKSNSLVGGEGDGMGYSGITPSFGIEFDTFHNTIDPTNEDHISFVKNGNVANRLCNLYASLSNIEDGNDHSVKIIWDPFSEHMAVFFDNHTSEPTLQMVVGLGNILQSGEAFWGFTAATGYYSNVQSVCITELKTGSADVRVLNPNQGNDCDDYD